MYLQSLQILVRIPEAIFDITAKNTLALVTLARPRRQVLIYRCISNHYRPLQAIYKRGKKIGTCVGT